MSNSFILPRLYLISVRSDLFMGEEAKEEQPFGLMQFMESIDAKMAAILAYLESIDSRLDDLGELIFESSSDLDEGMQATQLSTEKTVNELSALKTEGLKIRPR